MNGDAWAAAADKMREAGQPEGAIRAFARAYERLVGGEEVTLPSSELEPAADILTLDQLPDADDPGVLGHVAVIKLNGGLATTMGLRAPKSLLEAREGRSFLDVIVGQALALRRRHGVQLPLVFMDSEATRTDTVRALEAHPEIRDELPADFLQSMVPKLDATTLTPVSWPSEPALEWCPPGHGDVYGALDRSGMLAMLLERDIRYAMISNADNLGATLDSRIAAHMAEAEVPFLMEVVAGTEADRKGGHIARRRADGRLILRETAQTPPEDLDSFRDFRRWRYYNTNNLWLDLRALDATLRESGGVLDLPLIVNRKTVDPRDSGSPSVLQLESAMGAALGSFAGASVILVPRTRFVPVKTTDDLLVLRSDVYSLSDGMSVVARPERAGRLPLVELDPRFYKLLDDFEARFPAGPPSLIGAERLTVRGDVTFGPGVSVRGAVEFEVPEPLRVERAVLSGAAAASP